MQHPAAPIAIGDGHRKLGQVKRRSQERSRSQLSKFYLYVSGIMRLLFRLLLSAIELFSILSCAGRLSVVVVSNAACLK
ncbi:hypothetical protein TNCV_2953511 [Trichonephila clavipes]|nr:hypothetical protein TNCV_2953511 [Trichonephila clavipes]